MTAIAATHFACSQCGCAAPPQPEELRTWVYGRLALSGEWADVIDRLLLCPACVQEGHGHDFEEGGGD